MSYPVDLTKQVASNANLIDRFGQAFAVNVKSFVSQVVSLRNFGLKISSDYALASSIFLSSIAKLEDVKDCTCLKQNKDLNLFAYLEKFNLDTETKIYEIHRQLLRSFPDTNIDVRVVELYGRSKAELEPVIK
jgi:hypothetical protein